MKDMILSLSGGLDSSSLLFEYKDDIIMAVSFTYGSNHNKMENAAAKLVAEKAGVPWHLVDLTEAFKGIKSGLMSGADCIPDAEYNPESIAQSVVPFRNGIFLSVLAGMAESCGAKRIALASHGGDHCLTKESMVMTPCGVKYISNLKIGDPIYSFNTSTNQIEVDKVTAVVNNGAAAEVYDIDTFAGRVSATGEHKVYVLELGNFDPVNGYDKSITMKRVDELVDSDMLIQPTGFVGCDSEIQTIDVKPILESIKQKHNAEFEIFEEDGLIWINQPQFKRLAIPRNINASEFVKLMAWYITEGCSSKEGFAGDNKTGKKYSASFTQSLSANFEKVDLIEESIKSLDVSIRREFSKKEHNGMPQMVTYYVTNVMSCFMKDCGSHSSMKHIPNWLMDILLASNRLREDFINTLILGDGYHQGFAGYGYCSNSEVLIRQLEFLLSISGMHYSYSKHDIHRITINGKGRKSAAVSLGNAKFAKIKSITKRDYGDDVYDITVEHNHNFFAGEIGFQLVSNCIYKDCRPEFSAAMEQAIKLGTDHGITFFYPYANLTKREVAKRGIAAGLNPDWTYSCYRGGEKPCGVCSTCRERAEALEGLSW